MARIVIAVLAAWGIAISLLRGSLSAQDGPVDQNATTVPQDTIFLTGTASAEAVDSGIEGQVILGPTQPGPVPIGEASPDQPYPTSITILDYSGQAIAHIATDPIGRFRVALAPGEYTLKPDSTGRLPFAKPQTVVVSPGQFTQVLIRYDTGMR